MEMLIKATATAPMRASMNENGRCPHPDRRPRVASGGLVSESLPYVAFIGILYCTVALVTTAVY